MQCRRIRNTRRFCGTLLTVADFARAASAVSVNTHSLYDALTEAKRLLESY